jgi:multidrug resistance efflux pump
VCGAHAAGIQSGVTHIDGSDRLPVRIRIRPSGEALPVLASLICGVVRVDQRHSTHESRAFFDAARSWLSFIISSRAIPG